MVSSNNSKFVRLIGLTIFGVCIQFQTIFNYQVSGQTQNLTSTSHLRRHARSLNTDIMGKENARQICSGCSDKNSGRCSRKAFIRIKRYTEELKCQPEYSLVKIIEPGPHFAVEPSLAKIKRCKGYCRAGFHSCLPIKTSFIKVPVILTDHGSGEAKCVNYEIEQHDECACDCEVKKEHCSQIHRHERCSCRCANQEEKYKCLENANINIHKNVWDEDQCKCICEPEQCPVGYAWNTEICRCDEKLELDLENMLY